MFLRPDLAEARSKVLQRPPSITLVILNWNRKDLLIRTVYSLLATSPRDSELIVVDNASTDGSREWLTEFGKYAQRFKAVLLDENSGGEALNPVLQDCRSEYILISENDMEYRPGWYVEMLAPFLAFRDLGQLSPLSPFPSPNETWGVKPHRKLEGAGGVLLEALANVGTSCVIRREVIRKGARWRNLVSQDGKFKMPADGEFSSAIRNLGYSIAWSSESQVVNWGHNPEQWRADPAYYLKNWEAKSRFAIDGLGASSLDVGVLCQELEALKSRYRMLQRHVSDDEVLRKVGVIPELTHLYVDTGKGFVPELVVQSTIDPTRREFEVEFDISKFSGIRALRWDPIEGEYCRIRNLTARLESSGGTLVEMSSGDFEFSRAKVEADGWILFRTTDPMVTFVFTGAARRLRISGEWRIAPDEVQPR